MSDLPKVSVHAANALLASIGMRDIDSARRSYPKICAEELQELRKALQGVVINARKEPSDSKLWEAFDDAARQSGIGQDDPSLLVPFLFLATGAMDDPSGRNGKEAMGRRLEEHGKSLATLALPIVESSLKRIAEIRLQDCRMPDPEVAPQYGSPRRMARLLALYWGIGRTAILDQIGAMCAFRPYPLLPLIANIQFRIAACFEHLRDVPRSTEAEEKVSSLLDMLTQGEVDDLSAAPEWTQREIAVVDVFIEQAKATIGSDGSALTREEQECLDVGYKMLADLKLQVSRRWNTILARIDANKVKSGVEPISVKTLQIPSEAEILNVICPGGEDEITEFKEGRVDARSVAKQIVALSHNTRGGRIFIGIEDDGQVSGCNLTKQEFNESLQNAVRNTVDPSPLFALAEVQVAQCRVLVVVVSPWDRKTVFQHDGRIYVRKGPTTFAANAAECRKLFAGEQLD